MPCRLRCILQTLKRRKKKKKYINILYYRPSSRRQMDGKLVVLDCAAIGICLVVSVHYADSISRQHLNGRSSVDWRARSHVMTAWSSAEVCLAGKTAPVIVFSLGVVVGVCCAGMPTAKLPKMVRAYTRPCE
jgi:hypothetical protein